MTMMGETVGLRRGVPVLSTMLAGSRDRLWVVQETLRANRAWSAAAIVLIVVRSVLPLLSFVFTGYLIGSVPGAVRDGLDSTDGHHALVALGGLIAAFLILRLAIP